MFKRGITVLLCVALIGLLTISAAAETVKGATYKKDGPYVVGFANVWVGNTWGVQCVYEFEAAARRHQKDIKAYYITDAQNNAAKQIADVGSAG